MKPYYPINDVANSAIYAKYREKDETIPNLIVGGRLAEYKCYAMAPTVEKVMALFLKR